MRYSMPLAQTFAEAAAKREVGDVRLMAIAVRTAHHASKNDFSKFLRQLDEGG